MKLSFAAAKNLLNDARLAAILDLLNGNGEETRLVGGAVRNAVSYTHLDVYKRQD